MRRHRSDHNQAEIVKGLRGYGVSVFILSNVGGGCPDILCGYRNKNYIIQIKRGDVPPSQRKLTPDEAEFASRWNGQYDVAHTLEEALIAVGIKKK